MDMEEEEEKDQKYFGWQVKSPEIVEIGEDNSKSIISCRNDVYVAVGKNDLQVVQWAIDHHFSPGTHLILVHVFPPITYIPTPVGKLSRSQLSKDQVQVYENEERNKRRNLLEKYLRLCYESKVPVDTMLLESNATAKSILDLIPVVNITNLIMGTKRYPPLTRQLRRMGQGKGEFVQKSAPDYCKVTIVCNNNNNNGKKMLLHQQKETANFPSKMASGRRATTTPTSERNFFECIICFSPGKIK